MRSTWKDVQCQVSLGNCELKQQRGTNTHLLGGSESKTRVTPSADMGVQPTGIQIHRRGNANGAATLEDSLEISYKTKYTITIWSSNHTPQYLLKWIENVCPHKKLHTNIYSKFSPKFQNLEVTKMAFSRWRDKVWSHPDNGTGSVLRRNEPSSHEKTGRGVTCVSLRERGQSEKPTHCMIPTTWHFGKSKPVKTGKDHCFGDRVGRDE